MYVLKGKTVNARHESTVNACDGYISIYECGKNIWHLTYKPECTTTYYIKKVAMNFMEEFSKFKFDFEDLQNRVADFK